MFPFCQEAATLLNVKSGEFLSKEAALRHAPPCASIILLCCEIKGKKDIRSNGGRGYTMMLHKITIPKTASNKLTFCPLQCHRDIAWADLAESSILVRLALCLAKELHQLPPH